MIDLATPPLSDFPVPPLPEIRARLARLATEAELYRKLLELALKRQREAERLSSTNWADVGGAV